MLWILSVTVTGALFTTLETRMNRRLATCVAALGSAIVFCFSSAALAQTAPSLGTAQSFAVLGGSTVTNTGPSVITGDLGVSPGSAITCFPPGTATRTTHPAGADSLQAPNDVPTQHNPLSAAASPNQLTGVYLG